MTSNDRIPPPHTVARLASDADFHGTAEATSLVRLAHGVSCFLHVPLVASHLHIEDPCRFRTELRSRRRAPLCRRREHRPSCPRVAVHCPSSAYRARGAPVSRRPGLLSDRPRAAPGRATPWHRALATATMTPRTTGRSKPPMTTHEIAAAMRRVEPILQRRPDDGLHDDAPATASWRGSTRIVTSHANGIEIATDMPGELGGTGDKSRRAGSCAPVLRPARRRESRWVPRRRASS